MGVCCGFNGCANPTFDVAVLITASTTNVDFYLSDCKQNVDMMCSFFFIKSMFIAIIVKMYLTWNGKFS